MIAIMQGVWCRGSNVNAIMQRVWCRGSGVNAIMNEWINFISPTRA